MHHVRFHPAHVLLDAGRDRLPSIQLSHVPPDTPREIFDACCVPGASVNLVLDTSIVRAGPLRVAAICADWRRLALATLSLWTDVLFNFYIHATYGVSCLLLRRS